MDGSIGRLIDGLVEDRDKVEPDEENTPPLRHGRSSVWTRLEGGSFTSPRKSVFTRLEGGSLKSPRKSVFTRLEGGAAVREITNRVTGSAAEPPNLRARRMVLGPKLR